MLFPFQLNFPNLYYMNLSKYKNKDCAIIMSSSSSSHDCSSLTYSLYSTIQYESPQLQSHSTNIYKFSAFWRSLYYKKNISIMQHLFLFLLDSLTKSGKYSTVQFCQDLNHMPILKTISWPKIINSLAFLRIYTNLQPDSLLCIIMYNLSTKSKSKYLRQYQIRGSVTQALISWINHQ